jgi:hypothetical protein
MPGQMLKSACVELPFEIDQHFLFSSFDSISVVDQSI